MSSPIAHLVVVPVIARQLAPLAGILLLGWQAPNVLLLYFADTLFAIAVIAAGVLRHFHPPPEDTDFADRINGEAGAVAGGLFIAAVLAVPLGVPLFFMVGNGFRWSEVIADPQWQGALAWQAVAAWWSYLGLYRALAVLTPDELRLRRRFALLFLRWMALAMVAYSGVGVLLGAHTALSFVALYALLSIWAEIAPDRLLRMLPGGVAHAAPAPAATPRPPPDRRPR
jgi:hypothetical protein